MTVTFFDCNSIPEDRRGQNMSYIVLLILKFNDNKEPIWYGKIRDTVVPEKMPMEEFQCAFNFLEDTRWIYREAGSLGNGRGGFRYYITDWRLPGLREEIEKQMKAKERE